MIPEHYIQFIETFSKDKNEVHLKYLYPNEKAESNILSIKEIKQLSEGLNTADGKALFKELIPEPENITSNDIFSEISRLSVYGLIPVLGGIAGGIAGDMLTDPDYKAKIQTKLKKERTNISPIFSSAISERELHSAY